MAAALLNTSEALLVPSAWRTGIRSTVWWVWVTTVSEFLLSMGTSPSRLEMWSGLLSVVCSALSLGVVSGTAASLPGTSLAPWVPSTWHNSTSSTGSQWWMWGAVSSEFVPCPSLSRSLGTSPSTSSPLTLSMSACAYSWSLNTYLFNGNIPVALNPFSAFFVVTALMLACLKIPATWN